MILTLHVTVKENAGNVITIVEENILTKHIFIDTSEKPKNIFT